MPNGLIRVKMSETRSLPVTAYLWASVAVVAAIATANPLLTAASIFVLLLLARLLWRPGEPPALLFAASYQWVQVSTLVFVADYQRRPVAAMSFSPSVEKAIWLGLMGLAVLATGMRLGVRRLKKTPLTDLDADLRAFSVDRVFAVYAFSAIIAAVVPYFIWGLLPIAQVLIAIATLKWVFYMMLGYVTLRRRTKVGYFVAATLAEFIAGIGFFSGFKTVFFVCGLLILSVRMRINLRMIAAGVVMLGIATVAGLAWMTIRNDYRAFLNQGTGQQVVLVSPVKQVTEFGNLISSVDAEELQSSADEMLTRIAYVDYLAAVLDYVPARRPFEEGRLLAATIRHILIPRFLDPEKEILESDSEITMRYTGLTVASSKEGTSIGIGYMAEGYVDFGVFGMLVLVLVFGMLWGRMFAWLVSHAGVTMTGLAFGTALIIDASQFEVAEIKLLGGMVAKFLIFAVILRFVMPYLNSWLMRGRKNLGGLNAVMETSLADMHSSLRAGVE
jgi:hypothetical protein